MRLEQASITPLPYPRSELPRVVSSLEESIYATSRPRPQHHVAKARSGNLFLSDTFSPSLAFSNFGTSRKRSASLMEPEKSYPSKLRQSKRTTISFNTTAEQPSLSPLQSTCLDTLFDIDIPDEPSFVLNTSSDASDSGTDSCFCSTPTNIFLSSKHSSESATPGKLSQEPSFDASKSKDLSCLSESPTPSIPKRLKAPRSSSPRPLQFINKSGPPAPRQKPQLPTGVYIQTHSAIQQKARKQIREEGKVKRTSNCFIKYRTHMHPIIVAHFGHQNNKEISRLAGRYWKNEPEDVKNIYRQQAAEEKVRHATLYPSYKYTPAKPTPKSESSSDSGKSRVKNPWNNSTQLSSPPAQLPSSPVPLLSLSTRPEPEDRKREDVKREDESTETPSPPRAAAPENPTTSPADSPLSTKRGFVVTETALFDFKGDADLIEKKHGSKCRPGKRSNRSPQRLLGLVDQLSPELPLASTSGVSTTSASSPFTFVPQGPTLSSTSLSAGPKGVASELTQALVQRRSESQAALPPPNTSTLRNPTSNATSSWSVMSSRFQTSRLNTQQRWSVPQQETCLAAPVLSTLTARPLNSMFHRNIGVSIGDTDVLATDQNWAQVHPLSPQPPPSFLPHLASNFDRIPLPSTPIQIPVPPVVTTQFSESFSSPVYTTATPITPSVAAMSTLGVDSRIPWQPDLTFSGISDFGLLYSPQPCGSISNAPTDLFSTPLSTMHMQQGMISPSSAYAHPLTISLEGGLASIDFEREISSSQASEEVFAETVWGVNGLSSMASTTATAWEYPLFVPNQDNADSSQKSLPTASSCDPSLSLSTTSGPVYPEMDMTTWTSFGEDHVPSQVCTPDENNNKNDTASESNNVAFINDSVIIADVTSTSSSSSRGDGTVEKGQVAKLPSQSASAKDSQSSLAWDEEEQLKKSITYYEEIVQHQKMLLNLQRQWRQQAQIVPSSILASRIE
ncbi:hypothetical protein EC991_005982 [Linnemannia zychae]|nr:hypothetical protein EC991_005982 [Linnemannia zychae]